MNEERFKIYYEQYGHLVFKRAIEIVRNEDDARDVVQTVFYRIWKYGDKFRRKSDVFTWIYRITTNCSFDLLKKRTKHGNVVPLEDRNVPAIEISEDYFENKDLLMKKLAQFGKKTRQIILLYFIESLTQQEIAEFLNISRKTVGKKIKKFQQTLKETSQ